LRRRDCADSDRLRGQALLAFSHQVPEGASSVELPNPEGLDNTITVLLDPRKDPAGNAQIYFKRYRKALDNAGGVEREIDRLEAKLEELDVERAIIDKADLKALFVLREERHPAKNRSKKKGQTPSHLCLDYDGCRILVGLTAKGNRFVTFDQASREDIWFHARNLPGAHVILKCPSEDIPDGAFEVAASLAAHYSRGAGDEPVTIDYTEKKHVRHIPGKGPAHVTYRNFASITISPGRWREKIEGIEQAPPVKGNGN
jgi:predicted ribosome quality control (RQC) complex YloA/Tae2 family protein